MSRDPHPSDWNRLFDPSYRRRGIVGLFSLVILSGCLMVMLFVGGAFGHREVQEHARNLHATQTPAWGAYYEMRTATAVARTATAQQAATPGPVASVANAGNFRSAPELVPQTIVGQVLVGDQVALLENRSVAGHVWYRVRLTQTAGSLPKDTEGWVSQTLLAVASAGTTAP
jgi:hypothetical protein